MKPFPRVPSFQCSSVGTRLGYSEIVGQSGQVCITTQSVVTRGKTHQTQRTNHETLCNWH